MEEITVQGAKPTETQYYGPYKIKRRVSDVCYVISTPDRRRKESVCHINLVKPYKVRSTALPISLLTAMDDESTSEIVETKLKNSQILQDMDGTLAHLSPTQDQQIRSTIKQHLPLFPDTPGITHVMKLDVDVGDAEPIRQHPYRLKPTKQAILQKEVRNMLDLLKGYYQILLTDRPKQILTMTTPEGLYQYKVMSFGLKTAPVAFQRHI